jgi:hypothetical protein
MRAVPSYGCVAWDSTGQLVLGKTVLQGSTQMGQIPAERRPMPQISEGDEIAVWFEQNAGLSFTKNGKVGAGDISRN